MDEQRFEPTPLIAEAASVVQLLGGVGKRHLTIVGGIVPALLVPHAEHVGSRDVDFCLSLAFTRGTTRDYYKSIEEILSPYFLLSQTHPFRFIKKYGFGLPIAVDFLAPEVAEPRPVRALAELAEDQKGTAMANSGPRLDPFPIRCGGLIDADTEVAELQAVPYVFRPGVVFDVSVRHAGPAAFLAAKGDALGNRDEPKDGYDVSWWCLHAGPTPEAIAGQVTSRAAFEHAFMCEAIVMLEAAFRAPNYPGPMGYAEVLLGAASEKESHARACNEAYTRVSAVLQLLRAALQWPNEPSQDEGPT